MIKKTINNFLNRFGYQITSISSTDSIYVNYIKNKNPIIFDVGANKGQSIIRFNKIFKEPQIHAFEPIPICYKFLLNNFNTKNNTLNNFALGSEKTKKMFNVYAKKGNSSFFELNKKSKWFKKHLSSSGLNANQITEERIEVNIETLDNYLEKNKIKKIDLIKIDTQGFEEEVLKGSIKSIEKNSIEFIEIEMMFENLYEKYTNFIDIERYLIKNNYRLIGINRPTNIISKSNFSADVTYTLNKNIDE